MINTRKGETYIVGIAIDELRREPCAGGCGRNVMLAETSWQSAIENARNLGMPRGSVKACCRQCLSGSGMVPVSG